MNFADRSLRAVPGEPAETNTILFEWPLKNLRHLFDSSKADVKSKVVKSIVFGGGRWTVLFYAQSGHDQYCSLYLNAEPTLEERSAALMLSPNSNASASLPSLSNVTGGSGGGGGFTKSGNERERTVLQDPVKWQREGHFKFVFTIQTIDKGTVLGSKEAHDHAFSWKTSNWGWAAFAKRDVCFYNNSNVRAADAFLISVSITASPKRPSVPRMPIQSVPKGLLDSVGALLDDPEYSDVVFSIVPRRGTGRRRRARKIYAIEKILSARAEYFADLFRWGAESTSQDDTCSTPPSPLLSSAASVDHSPPQQGGLPLMLAYDGDEGEDGDDIVGFESDEEFEEVVHPILSLERGEDGSASAVVSNVGSRRVGNAQEAASEGSYEDSNSMIDVAISDGYAGVSFPRPEDASEKGSSARSTGEGTGGGANEDGEGHESVFAARPGGAPSSAASSSALRDSMDVSGTEAESTVKSAIHESRRRRVPSSRDAGEGEGRKRRKVVVQDAAYNTFKSLLYYLYTDDIVFAPLTSSFLDLSTAPSTPDDLGLRTTRSHRKYASASSSLAEPATGRAESVACYMPSSSMDASVGTGTCLFSGVANKSGSSMAAARGQKSAYARAVFDARLKRQAVVQAYANSHPGQPVPCSAKAIYRLADKVNLPELKQRAFEHISNCLTVQNIVFEVFSGFNLAYEEIRKMEIDFLLRNWPQVKRGSAMKTIFQHVGAHPGLGEVWPLIIDQLEFKPRTDSEEEEEEEDM